jgi:hypothetical protein
MAAWIACALVALVLLKPQEVAPLLAGLPLLHLAFAATVACAARDVIHRRVHLCLAPQVPFVLAFFGWALVITAVKRPDGLGAAVSSLAILAGPFLAVAVGCASRAGVRAFAWTFAGAAALVTVVALAQSRRPFVCFLAAPDDWEGRGELAYDGRPCETALDCHAGAPVPDGNYRCERSGPLETTTIGGRIRYRGSLADPNELSLAIAAALPFVLALASRPNRTASVSERTLAATVRERHAGHPLPDGRGRGPLPDGRGSAGSAYLPPLLTDGLLSGLARLGRAVPALAQVVATSAAVILSQSRSGLLVLLIVLGAQALRWAGAWGVVVGCVLCPPLLLLGGRSGVEADESADERVEVLREAFELIRGTRGVGLGFGQFTDASSLGLTAHNAYVLAAAETGVVGLWLFCLALYLSLKVPVAVWLSDRRPPADLARMAPAVAIAIAGASAGILFLSWTYKDVLYLLMGASAALFAAARAEDPSLRVRLSWKEAGLVGALAHGLLAVVYVGARLYR